MRDRVRLTSAVSLRLVGGTYRTKFASPPLLLPLALFLSMLLFQGCSQKTDFPSQGLPDDFSNYFRQLRVLKLPPSVTHLDWLPSTLERLDVSHTMITALPFVPPGLQELDVSYAKDLKQLPILPPSLKELDIRFTEIAGPWGFLRYAESLHLGGAQVTTLQGFSESLLELSLEDARIQSIAGLPSSLQSLSISGAPLSESRGEPLLQELRKLPPRLKELRLTNTRIEALKGLPPSLQSLALVNIGAMEVELPALLVNLTLGGDHQRVSALDELRFLNRLELQSAVSLTALPPFLRSLRVLAPGPWAREQITPSLKTMNFETDMLPVLPSLPQGLEELRWPGAPSVAGLPSSLKSLEIPFSPLTDLTGVSASLMSLDISGTAIPIDKLPSTLQHLRFKLCPFKEAHGLPAALRSLDLSGAKGLTTIDLRSLAHLERLDISETSISDIPVLPATLLELDISNTPIRTLRNLPQGLRRLTVHGGQLRTLAGLPGTVTELYFQGSL